jgi:hypothetical protein
VGVEDERLEGSGGFPAGRRDAGDDSLEDLADPDPLLGRRQDDLFARDGERLLQLGKDSIPWVASTTRIAPSQACSERLTSYVKSTWPGVSIRLRA